MVSKDWLEKDYYAILGLKKDAGEADIKKAFRKLARDNHPDRHPDDKAAERRFKEASEANDVLSDPDKRKEYDEARALLGSGFRSTRGGPSASGPMGGVNLEDLLGGAAGGAMGGGFGDLFGGLFGGGGASRGPRRGHDLEGEVTVSFADAAAGVTVAVALSADAACPTCRGTGARKGTQPRVCPSCQGSGTVTRQRGGFAAPEACGQCQGRGLVIDDPCPDCGGSGRGRPTRTVQARVPAGVADGQRIRVKGKGGPGAGGGAPGDLHVIVHVRPHPLFGRQGDNLTLTAPVTYAEAALGAEIDVPTLAGPSVRLRLPPGTPNGRTFRVRGKGIAKKTGATDLLVTVEVQVPHQLSAEAREQLQAYVRLAAEPDPRARLKVAS
ncbi:MAG: molecular chaperone DnaJ [Propionibacteriaceae bacterium]|jgi:molecular chaperone DnaJ|nr:molecular chaperone DnaJ [Propionibacteriaceae bacterium]